MNRETWDELMLRAARGLAQARLLIVFTGAGVSKESGIATFRDRDEGLWARYDPLQLATLEGYLDNPRMVWEWYEHRFGTVERAAPNPGHIAVAELEGLLPQVVVVTQNVDGLHQRAGSTDVVELHGSMHRYKCLSGRHTGFSRADVTRLLDTDVRDERRSAARQAKQQPRREKPPRCPQCGDLLRPDVVWFGESLPEAELGRAFRLAQTCDAMLVVGTSGVVQPAASLPLLAARCGAFVVDVNPERDELAAVANVYVRGPGGEVLPRVVAALRDEMRRPGPG
jgi:NAD-dependent deacetylase